MHTATVLLRWKVLRLSLKIAVLFDLVKVQTQFVFDGVLDLLDAILHEEELLELGVGPWPCGPAGARLIPPSLTLTGNLAMLVSRLVLYAHDPWHRRLHL